MIGLESCGLIICFDCDLKMTGIFDISDDCHDGIVRNCLIETGDLAGEFEFNEEEILATMSLSNVYRYSMGPSLYAQKSWHYSSSKRTGWQASASLLRPSVSVRVPRYDLQPFGTTLNVPT